MLPSDEYNEYERSGQACNKQLMQKEDVIHEVLQRQLRDGEFELGM